MRILLIDIIQLNYTSWLIILKIHDTDYLMDILIDNILGRICDFLIVDHDVSTQNMWYDVGYYDDADISIRDVSEARDGKDKDEEEAFEDFINDEAKELKVNDMYVDDSGGWWWWFKFKSRVKFYRI